MLRDDDLGSSLREIEESTKDLLDVTDEAPIIRLVNSILAQAVKERVSDIHIEPFEKFLSVRFRKDGILREVLRPPKKFQASISSRIKIMGNLNIAEKRLPRTAASGAWWRARRSTSVFRPCPPRSASAWSCVSWTGRPCSWT